MTTFATQLGSHIQESQNAQGRGSNVSTPRGSLPAGKCYSCEACHKIEHCSDFTSKCVRQRMIFVRYKGLCLNCLRRGHFAGECKSAFRCKHCQQPHHTLLHKSLEDHVDTGTGDGGDQAVKEPAKEKKFFFFMLTFFFFFLLVQLQIYTLLYNENYTLTYNT